MATQRGCVTYGWGILLWRLLWRWWQLLVDVEGGREAGLLGGRDGGYWGLGLGDGGRDPLHLLQPLGQLLRRAHGRSRTFCVRPCDGHIIATIQQRCSVSVSASSIS